MTCCPAGARHHFRQCHLRFAISTSLVYSRRDAPFFLLAPRPHVYQHFFVSRFSSACIYGPSRLCISIVPILVYRSSSRMPDLAMQLDDLNCIQHGTPVLHVLASIGVDVASAARSPRYDGAQHQTICLYLPVLGLSCALSFGLLIQSSSFPPMPFEAAPDHIQVSGCNTLVHCLELDPTMMEWR